MSWKKVLVVVVGLILFMFWMYVPEDEYEDEYSVTFTYDCREVMLDEDVPEHVLEECRIIMKGLVNDK